MKSTVGLAGTGVWAQRVHLPALAAHPDVTLAGIWGRDQAKTRSIGDKFGIRVFDRYDQLLEAAEIVDLAIVPGLQPEYGLQAADAGCHLMLEKPAGIDAPSVKALHQTITIRGLAATVFLGRFFDSERLRWLEAQANRRWEHASAEWIASSFLAGNAFAGPWRDQAGALYDVGPHILSQLDFLLGPVTDFTISNWDAEGDLALAFHHESGATSDVLINVHTAVDQTREVLVLTGPGESAVSPHSPIKHGVAFTAMIDHILAQIRHAETNDSITRMTGTGAALRHVELMERIHAAAPQAAAH